MPGRRVPGDLDRQVPPAVATTGAQALNALASGLGAVFAVASRTDGDVGAVLLAAGAAQLVTALVIIIGCRLLSSGTGRALAITLGGLARGAVIVAAFGVLGTQVGASDAAGLVLTSVVFTWTWLLTAAVVIQGTRDYRAMFAERYQRAVVEGMAGADAAEAGPLAFATQAALAEHTAARTRVESLASRDDISTEADVAREMLAIADELHSAASTRIRPLSHRMWAGGRHSAPELGLFAVLVRALTTWTTPVLPVVLVVFVVVLIGATVSGGPGLGAFAALTSSVVVACCMWLRNALPERAVFGSGGAWLRAFLLVAVGPLVFGVLQLGGTWLRISSPGAGSLVVAAGSFVLVFASVAIVGISRHRALLIAEMDELLATGFWRAEVALSVYARQSSEAAVFLHHRVQSDLLAAALQLEMAAQQTDPLAAAGVLRDVRERLGAVPMAPASALATAAAVRAVREEWAGICAVSLDLPADDALPSHLWHRIDLLVREAVANAVRAGGANTVDVRVRVATDGVDVVVTDDGRQVSEGSAGLGFDWLASVAGEWTLDTVGHHRELRAHLSL